MALTHWDCFLFFLRTAEVLALSLSAVFRRLVRLGSFPPCWRQANVTPIPKGPPSSSVANYQPISITSVLSKVFEHLVSVHLGRFMECSGVLPTAHCKASIWKLALENRVIYVLLRRHVDNHHRNSTCHAIFYPTQEAY